MRKTDFWDQTVEGPIISEVQGYLGVSPTKQNKKTNGTKAKNLYSLFKKLSSRERSNFLKLLQQDN